LRLLVDREFAMAAGEAKAIDPGNKKPPHPWDGAAHIREFGFIVGLAA
jgi:hypothetical protein